MSNKNINECEGGVPGGITPDCVGGMGSIELPGDNPNNGYDGIKGSGDIPKGSGHDYKQIIEAFEDAKKVTGKPTAIIAKTIKGKGVSYMENQASWHGKAPNEQELAQAMQELI